MWMLKRAVEKRFGPTVVRDVVYSQVGGDEESDRIYFVAKYHDVVIGLHVGDCIMLESSK